MSAQKKRLLILSFSPIERDARVLKQVIRFQDEYAVTTCGYGEAPSDRVKHIQIPASESFQDLDGRLITLRQYWLAYWRLSAVCWSRRRLAGERFELIIANDVEAVPVAVKLRPSDGVLADLHEYSPRLHEENPVWKRRISPWFDWVIRRYVTKAHAWSTVSQGLADEYARNFAFRPRLVTNAAPFHELAPTRVSRPIRLVHSGACLRNRNLDSMINVVEAASVDVTLDFYLTGNDPGFFDELCARAEQSSHVRVHHAVPYNELMATLNGFDAGIYLLPPSNFNNANALPNKIFDFIQARLGLVVSPTPEIAALVRQHDLGEVAADFTEQGLTLAIDRLTADRVAVFKQHSHDVAQMHSGEHQAEKWAELLGDIEAKACR